MENLLDKKTLAEIEKHLLAQQKQILGSLEDISRDDNHEADNTVAKFPEYGNKPLNIATCHGYISSNINSPFKISWLLERCLSIYCGCSV